MITKNDIPKMLDVHAPMSVLKQINKNYLYQLSILWANINNKSCYHIYDQEHIDLVGRYNKMVNAINNFDAGTIPVVKTNYNTFKNPWIISTIILAASNIIIVLLSH